MSDTPKPKKSLGQHWLDDQQTLNDICDLANLNLDDTIVEIGPGLGSLTKLLTVKSKQVIAIEIDSFLSSQLKSRVSADNLTVVNESILKFNLTNLPTDYKIVANIPYYLTSNLLRLLSETTNPPTLIVLLVQKEVAQRVGASAGDMSLLSITTQFYWQVELKQVVKADKFTPPPKVDSQVILLKRQKASPLPGIDEKRFFRLIKIGFSARRKTIENSIANGLRADKDTVGGYLLDANVKPNSRPQELDINEWYQIYKVFITNNLI